MCVVGIDDDSAGEVPLACVIVKEGQSVTEQEIIKIVEGTKCRMFISTPFISLIGTIPCSINCANFLSLNLQKA